MKLVKIPPDIRSYQERIFLNLTGRQVAALLLGGITIWAMYAKLSLPKAMKDYLLMLTVPFFFAFGWAKFQGLHIERWIPILLGYLLLPQHRPWQPEDEEG